MPKMYRAYTTDGTTLTPIHSKNPDRLVWGLPVIFTEDQIDGMDIPATTKKRLHGLKEGTVLKLGSVSMTQSHAIMVETKYDQGKIDTLEAELKEINAEIQSLVGDKIKRANQIRAELKALR